MTHTLKYIGLFENFDTLQEAKTKELNVADKNTVSKDLYKLLKQIMETSAEIEKELPEYEKLVLSVDDSIKKLDAEYEKKKKKLEEPLLPYKEKVENYKVMKAGALEVLLPYKTKSMKIKDLAIKIKDIVIKKGVYNKDGSPKTTYEWKAIAELTEKLVPVNATNIKLLAEIKETNKNQKLDQLGPDIFIEKFDESIVNESLLDLIKDAFKKAKTWFDKTFGGLLKMEAEVDAAVESSEEALVLANKLEKN